MNYWDPAYWTTQSLKINQHKRHKNITDNSTSWGSLHDGFRNRTKRDTQVHLPWNEGMSGCLKSLWAECREYKVYSETLRLSYFHSWEQLPWLLRIITFKETALHGPKGTSCECALKNLPPYWTESRSPWGKACSFKEVTVICMPVLNGLL